MNFLSLLKFLRFLITLETSWGTEGWRVHHKKLVETAYSPTYKEAVKNLLNRLKDLKWVMEELEGTLADDIQSDLDYIRKILDLIGENTPRQATEVMPCGHTALWVGGRVDNLNVWGVNFLCTHFDVSYQQFLRKMQIHMQECDGTQWNFFARGEWK